MTSIAGIITKKMESLTKAERKVARAVLAQYPVAGLETLASLGKRAEVSDPTVLRFTAKLGFKKFNDFQKALREEVDARMQSPASAEPYARIEGLQGNDAYGAFAAILAENIKESIIAIPDSEVERICELLLDTGRHIYIIGGEFSETAARHLYFHLRKMRKNITFIGDLPPSRNAYLPDLCRKDLLFVFDVRRYQKDIEEFSKRAAVSGCRIILVTDQLLSPIATLAAHVLPCKIDSLSPWDSLVAMNAVIELLIFVYMKKDWKTIKIRLEKLDTYVKEREAER